MLSNLELVLATLPPGVKEEMTKKISFVRHNIVLYMRHVYRTKHQANYYKHIKDNLKNVEALVVIDYKMTIEIPVRCAGSLYNLGTNDV